MRCHCLNSYCVQGKGSSFYLTWLCLCMCEIGIISHIHSSIQRSLQSLLSWLFFHSVISILLIKITNLNECEKAFESDSAQLEI